MFSLAKVLLILVVLCCTGCASHICIKTEVYKGKDLVQTKSFRMQAAQAARQATEAMASLDKIVASPAAVEFGQMVADYKAVLPDDIMGDPAAFAAAYKEATAEKAIKPQQPLIHTISRQAQGLDEAVKAGATDSDARPLLASLEANLQQLVQGLQARLDIMQDTEKNLYIGHISKNYSKGNKSTDEVQKNDQKLAAATGLPVTNDAERNAAISFLQTQVHLAGVNVAGIVKTKIVLPVQSVTNGVSETLMARLGDPNIPIIVGSPEEKWGKYANDVSSTNIFGNSESAFKMEGLGENHIKSVVFDPSEVTKVGLNVFSTTLRITAAAYGFPLPKPQESKEDSATDKETLSKPAIDAEVNLINTRGKVRRQRMEKYFWKVTDFAANFTGAGGAAAPTNEQAAVAALLECMAAEIENPEIMKCGGNNGI